MCVASFLLQAFPGVHKCFSSIPSFPSISLGASGNFQAGVSVASAEGGRGKGGGGGGGHHD